MKRFGALVAVLALVAFAAPAFAANLFMDVPMNHWAYDAVSQLASRGVVSGYPDGAFRAVEGHPLRDGLRRGQSPAYVDEQGFQEGPGTPQNSLWSSRTSLMPSA